MSRRPSQFRLNDGYLSLLDALAATAGGTRTGAVRNAAVAPGGEWWRPEVWLMPATPASDEGEGETL